MHGVVLRNSDADGGNFFHSIRRVNPHTRPSRNSDPLHVELDEDINQPLFHPANVTNDINGLGELQNGVSDKLPRAVPRYLATAVNINDRSTVSGTLRVLGSLSGRVNALMFEQDYGLRALPVYDLTVDRSLKLPCVVVFNETWGQTGD
jgi:hypothetical protein